MDYTKHFAFFSTGWDTLMDIEGQSGRTYIKGNVGIGTTVPRVKLDVNGSIQLPDDTASGKLVIGNFGSYLSRQASDGSTILQTGQASLLLNPTSGNVGIGTTVPNSPLEVNKAITFSSVDTFPQFIVKDEVGTTGGFSTGRQFGIGVDSSGFSFIQSLNRGIDVMPLVLQRYGGNVGIGTTSPETKLDVRGNLTLSSGGMSEIETIYKGPRWYHIGTRDNGGRFSIYEENLESKGFHLIGGSGNVGIGTTSPTAKLHISDPASVAVVRIESTAVNGSAQLNINSAAAGYPHILFTQGGAGRFEIGQVTNNGNFYFNNNTQTGESGSAMVISKAGNVGIGKTDPSQKLDVAGNIYASGSISGSNVTAHYQDLAEWVTSSEILEPGIVVSIDPGSLNQVIASEKAYDPKIAGVVSRQPGLILGEGGDGRYMIAHSGRVKVKVDASYGAIEIGDVLVASPIPGVAMKSQPKMIDGEPFHRPSTILGKALEPLSIGIGEILVLLALQ